MESAFFYNTFFALAPSHELPDDVLDIISSFSKPLKRRVVSCRWDETETEDDMLDKVDQWLTTDRAYELLHEGVIYSDQEDHLTHFNVDRKFDGTKWSFTVVMINIYGEMEENVINKREVFNLTFTRDELYRWDGDSYQTNNGYWWKILPDHDLVTHLQDNKGEVIRRI